MTTHRYDRAKRAVDVVVAAVALLVSLPLQLVVGLLVRLKLGPPVFFRQARPGKDGEVFDLIKFRSMKNPDPSRGLVTDADRLNGFGAVLRSTSLDELPTLWNVLKGDMSLVGPRPLLVQYLDRYSPLQARRHEVRPGITGLAQVAGRNALSWQAKFEKDVEYVDNRSALLDIKIILRTFASIVRREGIAADGDVTMPEFLGDRGIQP